jgi:oxygen-independent coproporphyrinogen-3 oxidase
LSLGIYIHIPFCRSKCNYCHFISIPFHKATAERYRKYLVREIRAVSTSVEREKVNSIYFGGGTPSLVPAEHIADILKECKYRFSVAEDCEISLEANPGTLSAEKLAFLQKAGVNRISLGAQSFVDKELASIGRLHNSETILQSRGQLRKSGFENLNLDLLLGLPDQTQQSWRHSLQAAVALSVPHISVYMLDLEEPCALSSMVANGWTHIPEEDLVSDLYLETIDFLSSYGYLQYEISNFSRPGYPCRHNLKYWMRKPVYGLGLGSHSFDRHSRYANSKDMDDYFRSIETGSSPVCGRYPVSALQALEETLFLGLRLTHGVDWNQLQRTYGGDILARYEASLRSFSARGWMEWENSTVRLTPSGMLLSNEIFQEFLK